MLLPLKYAFFALLAILANLLAQYLVIQILDFRYELYIALLVGTAVGLVCKYELDRLWIFSGADFKFERDSSQFIKYSAMGLITTVIFWGTELLFNAIFASPMAKYIGGGLGLTLGYILKYRLDKKYVFRIDHQVSS